VSVVEELKNKNIVHWFRKDQRVNDHAIFSNLGLFSTVTAFYVHDTEIESVFNLGFPKIGNHRKLFLEQSLNELRDSLASLNVQLHIFQSAEELIASTMLNTEVLSYQKLYGTEELSIEQTITSIFNGRTYVFDDFTLVDKNNLPFTLDNMPSLFTQFKNAVGAEGAYQETIQLPLLPTESTTYKLVGGETQALNRLTYYFTKSQLLSTYELTRNGMLGTDFSSRFSPWLAIGNITPRTIFDYIVRYEEEIESNKSTYWLIYELLWRDFFQLQLQLWGSLFFQVGGIQQKQIRYTSNTAAFEKWMQGNTGDDLVDANMRELNTTGWMSNRGRQNTASFLIHDLKQDWRWGAAYFESLLVDYDPASNWGNWMYIAGVGHDARPFRKFNTKLQAERYDSEGNYRKLWLK
jgi:deoxyribodipyrimidine photo-lyase